MVKRDSKLGFLGGAHVFPGGTVDADDLHRDFDALSNGRPLEAWQKSISSSSVERTRGFLVAALRELFEESGILLVDASLDDTDTETPRQDLLVGRRSFAAILEQLSARLEFDALHFFTHFITPKEGKKRFNTRFFVARVPDDQEPSHDRFETVDGSWLDPAEALNAYYDRNLELAPPTVYSLSWLKRFGDVEALMAAFCSHEPLRIEPNVAVDGDRVALLYPGDPDYESGTLREHTADAGLHRLILKDGLWHQP